jgi:hypothetical protein
MAKGRPPESAKSGRAGSQKDGRGRGKGDHPKLRKWEADRRRRQMMRAIPLLVVVAGVAAIVVAFAVLAPPPGPTGDGPCDGPRVTLRHYHATLQIYQDGAIRNIPGDIGVDPALTADRSLVKCTSGDPAHGASPVHTHAGESNLLHVETIVDRTYTLDDFFRVWGQPIGPNAVWTFRADATHRLTMTVNGQPSTAWGSLVIEDGMVIRIDFQTV